jgi:hypothetical protein
LQELKDIISGTIEVATIYSIGLHDLPQYLKRFMQPCYELCQAKSRRDLVFS